MPGSSVLCFLPEFPQIYYHCVSAAIYHLILCCPLLLLLSVFPSIRGPKYWSFSFSISPSNEYSGLISFRINWFDLLAIQGTLKSLLQHHSSNASVLQRSVFMIQHPYITTGKTTASTRWTVSSKVMSLLFSENSDPSPHFFEWGGA